MKLKLPIPAAEFASGLLRWYRGHKRPLPWRADNESLPDPYRVWLSEVMLQQTQVRTVLPYFKEFIDRYPTLEDLARAEENQVLASWSGLGYYSRARNLHKAARVVCEKYAGEFPREYDEAIQLPGVGRYTAGAVLSIVYGVPLPVLDGNVGRVLARYLGITQRLNGLISERLWRLLGEVARDPAVAPEIADFNQSLMELGALVCSPRQPQCCACPLAGTCRARAEGIQDTLPVSSRQRATQEFHFISAVIGSGKQFLLRQNHESDFLTGFWEFPWIDGRPDGGSQIAKTFFEKHGLKLRVEKVLPPVTHQITFRRLRFHPVVAFLQEPAPRDFTWVQPGQPGFPISSYIGKIQRALGG
ncbi:MAG: A/G-specific adenine glycosylase [Acidobacteriota bacterium]